MPVTASSLITPRARTRFRLESTPLVVPRRPRFRLEGNAPASPVPLRTRGHAEPPRVTPEDLAYALPGGLARLAYPTWMYGPHLKYLEDLVLKIASGKSLFICLSLPPRHGKTVFVSRVLTAWFLGRFPEKRVMLVTHTMNFSRTQSRHARNILATYGKQVFDMQLARDVKSAAEWDVDGHAGGMEALGAGSAIQGKGADLMILDDLVKGMEMARNHTLLEKQWEWFGADVYPRLEPGGSIIIPMTRWSSMDIIGCIERAQKEEGTFEEFEIVNIPALATKSDVLGRLPGQALFPARFSEEALLKKKARMDDSWWEALYQGNPIPAKGNIVNPDWLKPYDVEPPRSFFEMIVISADTASKETELADYSAIGVFGIKEGRYYLLDLIREKMAYPLLVETMRSLNTVWFPDVIVIEDKGSGTSLIQDLQKPLVGTPLTNIWPMQTGNDNKVLRMQAETPQLRAGVLLIPKEASWLDDLKNELRSFPRGHKDQADMISQFLKFVRLHQGGVKMW